VRPIVLVSSALVLLLAGLTASPFPTRRAVRVDPVIALRSESDRLVTMPRRAAN
jgi:ABC-type lipoprotein release transport system permease subunit